MNRRARERRALALLQGDDGSTALRGAAVPGGTPGAAVVLATFRAAAALQAASDGLERADGLADAADGGGGYALGPGECAQ